MNKDKGTKVGESVANAAALTGIGAAATGATAAAVGVATTVTTAGVGGSLVRSVNGVKVRNLRHLVELVV